MQTNPSDIIAIIVVSTIILLLLVSFIVIFLFVYQRRTYRHKRQVQKMQEEFNEEMLKSRIELQEQVLTSVSAEIHDNLGQMLSVVKLNLNKLGRQVQQGEGDTALIEDIKQQVSGVINDMRSISKTLSPDFIRDFGLEESLQFELQRIQQTGFINTTFSSTGHRARLDKIEIALFRIAQEIINNAIKHSGAKNLRVEIAYGPDVLTMLVQDDGKGFNIHETAKKDAVSTGSGLRNMKNRVKVIGGVLNLESSEGMGTTVKITINTRNHLFTKQPNL